MRIVERVCLGAERSHGQQESSYKYFEWPLEVLDHVLRPGVGEEDVESGGTVSRLHQ